MGLLSGSFLTGCTKKYKEPGFDLNANERAIHTTVFVNKTGRNIQKVAVRFMEPSEQRVATRRLDSLIGGPIAAMDSLIVKYNLDQNITGKENYHYVYVWFDIAKPPLKIEKNILFPGRFTAQNVRYQVYTDTIIFQLFKKK